MGNSNMAKNVVSLRIDSVYSDIENFLRDKKLRSENTMKAYRNDIESFFNVMLNKNIQELNYDDLCFKHKDVVRYRMFLVEKGYSNSSINRKIASVKSLFEFFERDNSNIRSSIFDVDRLKEKPVSYGVLSYEESKEMIELVKKQRKGLEKSLFIEFAVYTSFRLNAIMNLKWDNFTYDNQRGYWIVGVYDKGEKFDEKPISEDFYNRLCVLKNGDQKGISRNVDDEFVFHLNKKTPGEMIRSLLEEMGIEEGRNITFHSLKKVAINWILDNGGSVAEAAQQGNHSSPQTTLKHYAERKKDMSGMAGLKMGSEIDLSSLYNLSAEDLRNVILNLSVGGKMEVLKNLKGECNK